MSALIKYKIYEELDLNILMQYHNYTSYIIPEVFLQYTNLCINYDYKKCDTCGIQILSGLEEIISNYKKVISERYFINNKIIRIEDFAGLTCAEVMIKMALE